MHVPILTLEHGVVVAEVPRSSAFDHDMRRYLPGQARYPRGGLWAVRPEQLGALRLLLKEHFGGFYDKTGLPQDLPLPDGFDVMWRRRQGGPWAQPIRRSPYAVLFLLDTAPIEVVRAAHRALAKLHHPDAAQTDGRVMAEINAALEAIEGAHATERTDSERA